jgi:outer membrane immunogenic protein
MSKGLKALLASLAVTTALGTAAHAADLPSRYAPPAPAPVVAAVPVFTWTGFYVGVNAGYGWNTNDENVLVPGVGVVSSGDEGGFVGGGQIGYNYQIGSFVLGVETDIQYADIGGGSNYVGVLGYEDNSDGWFGTLRARAGVAFDRALVYVTGGLAYGDVGTSGRTFVDPTLAYYDNGDDVNVGWTLGGGLEYAFTDNLTAKVEGLYVNLESDNNNFALVDNNKETEFGVVRAGLNFKFGTY